MRSTPNWVSEPLPLPGRIGRAPWNFARANCARGPRKAPADRTGTHVLAHRATGSRNGTVIAEIHPSSEVIDATLLQATVERPARRERCARANSFHRCG